MLQRKRRGPGQLTEVFTFNRQTEDMSEQETKCSYCEHMSIITVNWVKKFLKLKMNNDQLIQNSIFSAMMMTNLINDLLDLGKLENNAFQLNVEEFNLFHLVQEAFSVVLFQAENKDINLQLQYTKKDVAAYQSVQMDKRRILQVLLNFISNSLKFTKPKGTIKLILRVLEEQVVETQQDQRESKRIPSLVNMPVATMRRSSSLHNLNNSFILRENEVSEVMKYIKLQITVEDNGVGISKKNQSMLFKDYQRLEEHQGMNAKGTGLGLSICQKIIDQMGGTINLESVEGKGTKIHIEVNCKSLEQLSQKNESSRSDSFKFKTMFKRVENYNSDKQGLRTY